MATTLTARAGLTRFTLLVDAEGLLVDPEVDLDRARLHVGGPFAWYLRRVKKRAITIGWNIWFRDEDARADAALVIHELVHVGQYRRLGTVRFLVRYGRDMAKAKFHYSHDLPLEAPAYARQQRASQLLDS